MTFYDDDIIMYYNFDFDNLKNLFNYQNNLIDKNDLIDFMKKNNLAHKIDISPVSYKNNNVKIIMAQYHDIVKEIIIIINKKNINFTVDLINSISINIAQLKTINYNVEKHNIMFIDNDIIKLTFNLKEIMKYSCITSQTYSTYKDLNFDGIPLILLNDVVVINIELSINDIINKDNYLQIFKVCQSGTLLLSNCLNNKYKYFNIGEILKFQNTKKNLFTPNLSYSSININPSSYINFNNLNIVDYTKSNTSTDNNIKLNLMINNNIKYLIFEIPYAIAKNINLFIVINDSNVFDANIFALYNQGYYVYKFNTSELYGCDIKVSLCNYSNDKSIFNNVDDFVIKIYTYDDSIYNNFICNLWTFFTAGNYF
jgi:hypothetical protein